jgi:excisionase family DNA binding protein
LQTLGPEGRGKRQSRNKGKKRKKPNKNKASGAISSARKSVIPGTPGTTERQEGGDRTMTQLLTIEDAQHILAVSRTTVWRLIQSGELETIHIRRSIRIPSDALQAYIDNARSPRGVTL